MMKPTLYIISFFLVIAFLSSCEEQKGEEKTSTSTASLKNTFKDDFLIGTALGTIHINKEDVAAQQLIETEFSSITPENDMKSMHIHPAQDTFYFEKADQFVAIGEQNEMYIIGHTLVWHSQLSKWWEAITDSTEMSQTIENHINTIVGRYKGRI
ncbi:MAG: endo-1,4-beta-xylanase, partial [Bacteroidota bacterium]